MRGASALQSVLAEVPDPSLTVLVVWLPVVGSDLGPPAASVRARVRDPRARTFWDPEHVVSGALLSWARRDSSWLPREDRERLREEGVVWDAAVLFPGGGRWSASPPVPTFFGYTVEASRDRLRQALEAERREPSPNR